MRILWRARATKRRRKRREGRPRTPRRVVPPHKILVNSRRILLEAYTVIDAPRPTQRHPVPPRIRRTMFSGTSSKRSSALQSFPVSPVFCSYAILIFTSLAVLLYYLSFHDNPKDSQSIVNNNAPPLLHAMTKFLTFSI